MTDFQGQISFSVVDFYKLQVKRGSRDLKVDDLEVDDLRGKVSNRGYNNKCQLAARGRKSADVIHLERSHLGGGLGHLRSCRCIPIHPLYRISPSYRQRTPSISHQITRTDGPPYQAARNVGAAPAVCTEITTLAKSLRSNATNEHHRNIATFSN